MMKAIICAVFIAYYCHAGLIENISMVESGNDDHTPGKHGELSRWQLMRYVRKDYPGTIWGDPQSARRAVVAELNLRSAKFCNRHGRWPTRFEQALLWHCPARVARPTTDGG